ARPTYTRSESPNLQRVAAGAFFDADENGVHAGAGQTEGPVGVEHGEGVFVGVVPDDVLVGVEHRHVHVLHTAVGRGENAIAATHLAAEREARDGLLVRLAPADDAGHRLHRV